MVAQDRKRARRKRLSLRLAAAPSAIVVLCTASSGFRGISLRAHRLWRHVLCIPRPLDSATPRAQQGKTSDMFALLACGIFPLL